MTEWHIYVIGAAAWLLSYIKLPFKKLTAKIEDETVRKRVNKIFILLPIIFGIAGVFVDSLIFGWEITDIWASVLSPGFTAAAVAVMIYSAVEKFFTGKTSGDTDELKALLSTLSAGDKNELSKLIDKISSGETAAVGELLTLISSYLTAGEPENAEMQKSSSETAGENAQNAADA